MAPSRIGRAVPWPLWTLIVALAMVVARPASGAWRSLDDHNPCTRDYADTQGEQHDPLPGGAPCDDDDACNGDETCDGAGTCLAAVAPAVDDGDPSTLDLCDYELGVRHKKPSVIDRILPTSIADSNAFLYQGDDALQIGVAANAIVRDHVAVLHGKVQARDGSALETVRITVHDHPELGRTATRPDGTFEMVVNGGGPLTVRYEKPGYLPVQRRVQTGWREHGYADDVVMIPVDDVVTEIDPTSTSMQVAQATLQSDERGPRRTMLLFQGETSATMTLPDGTTAPLDTLHVRATEYTVGTNGRQAIPATTPPNASPTYAVELSVDEALAQKAERVEFDKPVQVYVDNFMGFPAGTTVPFGYYDTTSASWVPSDNGVVIKVLDVAGGIAQLDADGDDTADDVTQLDAIGLSDDERIELATLFDAGGSFWRMPVRHFSSDAAGWGYGPPDCSRGPGGRDPCDGTEHPLAWPRTEEGPAVRDELAAHGTGMTLVYESSRMPGDKRPFRLVVPMTGNELPTGLKRIDVLAAVAGDVYEERRAPAVNDTYTLTFTGKEWADRPVQGAQSIVVQLGYVYACVPRDTPWYGGPGGPDRITTHLLSGEDDCETTLWREWRGHVGAFDPTPQGFHGYSLSAYHAYDADTGMLYRGDGPISDVKASGGGAEVFAGGDVAGWSSDLVPAKNSRFSWIAGLAPAPDGSVYLVDRGNQRIAKVRPDGLVETVVDGVLARTVAAAPDGTLFYTAGNQVFMRGKDGAVLPFAGNGQECHAPTVYEPPDGFNPGYDRVCWECNFDCVIENAPATMSKLSTPRGLAVGPDGSVYVGTYVDNAVWRIRPDGKIEHVFGSLRVGRLAAAYGDGWATDSAVRELGGIAVSKADELYVVETAWWVNGGLMNWDHGRVRRVGSSGFTSAFLNDDSDTLACDWSAYGAGDNRPATDACLLGGWQIATSPDGSVYVVDGARRGPPGSAQPVLGPSIRKVDQEGTITTVVDGPTWNGLPACDEDQAGFSDNGAYAWGRSSQRPIAVGPDGSLYWVNGCWNQRVMRIKPGAKQKGDELRVPSADGSEVFVFDEKGGHKRTEDAWLGTTMLTFDKNDDSALIAVHDTFGNTTSMPRHSPVGDIVAPKGETTHTSADGSGYMVQHVDPAQNQTTLSFSIDGMMQGKSTAAGATSSGFDAQGAVQTFTDAAGSHWTITEDGDSRQQHVHFTSALGRVQTQSTTYEQGGAIEYTYESPWKTTTTTRVEPNGAWSVQTPDGMQSSGTPKPHPQFGMDAPYFGEVTTRTPSGLTRSVETEILMPPGGEGGSSVPSGSEDESEPQPEWKEVRTRVNKHGWSSTKLVLSTGRVERTTAEGRTSVVHLNAQGQPTRVEVPLVNPTNTSYYPDGRVAKIEQGPDGQTPRTIWFSYDDAHRTTTATDSDGTVFIELDPDRRPVVVHLPDNEVLGLSFDQKGNLTSITPPGRDAHLMNYKGGVLFEAYIPPLLEAGAPRETKSWFDLDNQLDHVTYPDGRTWQLTPDDFGRLARSTDGEDAVDVTYDDKGRLKKQSQPEQSITYVYDGALPVSETWTGVVNATIQRLYHPTFALMNEVVDGIPVSYAYDEDGLPTTVGLQTLVWDQSIARLTGSYIGNTADTYGYDEFNELTYYSARLTGDAAAQPPTEPLYTEQLTRDSLGRISTKTETLQGVSTHRRFTYWPRGWLKDVWDNSDPGGPLGELLVNRYTYDANGNRLNGGASYDAQDRLSSVSASGFDYEYGNRGDLLKITGPAPGPGTSRPETGLHYRLSGALGHAVLQDGTALEYVNDPVGRRIAKLRNGSYEDRFVYRSGLQPVMWWDRNGRRWRFVYGTGRNVPDYMTDGTRAFRLVTDDIGSLRLVVNTASGEVVQTMMHDEWGVVTSESRAAGWEWVPFGFAGGIYDRDTGLVRFGARDYDPTIGRWTAKDPLLFDGGDSNLYLYAGGDPINRVDPSGEIAPALLVAAILGGGATLLGFGMSAPSDTAAMPADVWGMILSVTALKGLPEFGAARGGGRGLTRCRSCICFAPGTQVLMADGSTKAIETIAVGDSVLTDDPEDDSPPEAASVEDVHRTATYRLFHVQVDGAEGGEVLSTGRHPFWTKRGWVAAEELRDSDRLADRFGGSVEIAAISVESRDTPTFNLTVGKHHTFFVVAGRTPLLVHNVDPWDIMFSQSSYGPAFTDPASPWAGRSIEEAITQTRSLGRLPDGLRLEAVRVNDRWVTLNNRTLAVARRANLPNVNPVDAGPRGFNRLQRMLRDSDLVGPVEDAVMRCK